MIILYNIMPTATHCQGWVNPSSTFYGPIIISLSSYYSPAGSTSLVTITGENFYSYSTVLFGTFNPSVYFVSSNSLQFYVPSSLLPGIYPLQVFNGAVGSNIVSYSLDNSSGYWIINPNGSITNTNTGGIELSKSLTFADGTIQNTAYNPLIGEIKMFGGLTLPTNYLWCDGTSISTTTYATLFNVIGYKYGGAGATFNLPNLLQKFPLGSKDNTNMSVNYVDSNGLTNLLTTGGNQTMNTNQLGQHNHNFTGTSTVNNTNTYIDSVGVNNANNTTVTTAPTGQRVVNVNTSSQPFNNTLSITTNGTISNNNYSNTQETLLPPFTVLQYIICYQ